MQTYLFGQIEAACLSLFVAMASVLILHRPGIAISWIFLEMTVYELVGVQLFLQSECELGSGSDVHRVS